MSRNMVAEGPRLAKLHLKKDDVLWTDETTVEMLDHDGLNHLMKVMFLCCGMFWCLNEDGW